ncbi:tetratricopeptide repeat protein [Nesterenkonia populi]|uniref:tetratricopeptide repeat protein n=1 Tax=Nesterenkonia populi TaxID=1591087 RepID=UPI0011BEC74C|nr:tetratricopeptide repeat protein [Nesterenkonia populi]
MKSKFWTFLMVGLLGIFLVASWLIGIRFLRTGDVTAQLIGAGTIALTLIGSWVLFREISFGRGIERLGSQLYQEGGLPEDTVERSPGGRADRAQADKQFEKYKAQAEAKPDDWRSWFRLSMAYDTAGDRSRARQSMRRAIDMERAERTRQR